MNAYRLYDLFPVEINHWMKKYVNIRWDDSVPTAAVYLSDKDGYNILLNQQFMEKLSDAGKRMVILHEVSHIIRGDCLVMRNVEHPGNWNVASDAHINRQIGNIEDLEQESGMTFVQYERIKKENWPENIPATKTIYKLLSGEGMDADSQNSQGGNQEGSPEKKDGKENSRQNNSSGKEANSQNRGDSSSSSNDQNSKDAGSGGQNNKEDYALSSDVKGIEGDYQACKEKHAETILTAPKQFNAGANIKVGKSQTVVQKCTDPYLILVLKNLLKNVVPRYGSTKVRTRTWARENRSSSYFRGHLRQRRIKVVVALDVSGSMGEYVPSILGIASELKDKLDVTLIVWADSAQIIKSVNNSWNVGGGTDVNPAIELIDKNMPDVSIVITDGHFNTGMKKLPKSPVIWALTGKYSTSDMIISRNKDKIVKVKYEG